MQNKKQATIIAMIAIVLFGIVSFIFVHEPTRTSIKKITSINSSKTQDQTDTCEYKDDGEAYEYAISDLNIDVCSCIGSEGLMNTCKEVVYEHSLYQQALNQLNSDLCTEIKNEEVKNACVNTVQSKKEYLAKKDKQVLVDNYMLSHNTNESIEQLENLIQEDDKDIKNILNLALSYAEKGLYEQEQGNDQSKNVNKALEIVTKAKQTDENNSEVYRVEGYIYEIQPNIQNAIQSYTKAIELNEKNMMAYAGRGHVNRLIGVLDLAVEDFQKAAELDIENQQIFIYTNLCNLESSRGNNEEAIKNCTIVINSESKDAIFKSEAHQLMAGMYINEKKYNKANSHLLQAKTVTPNDANLFIEMARLNIYQGNYEKAGDDAKKATELSPNKAGAYLIFSQALYMEEKFDDSIAMAEKGLTLVQDDVSLLFSSKMPVERDLYYSIANNYRELGNTQKQQEYQNKAKSLENIK